MSESDSWAESSLDEKLVSDFMDKQSYVGKKYRAVVVGSNMGNFGKPVIHLLIGDKQVQTALSVNNQNWLIRNFGRQPKSWNKQVIFLTCVPIAFNDRKTKENKEGYQVVFSLE